MAGAQQLSRDLAEGTVHPRRSLVVRFRDFADSYPWSWNVGVVEEFFLELHAVGGAAHHGPRVAECAADVPAVPGGSRLWLG
jgi:hypothetical protein